MGKFLERERELYWFGNLRVVWLFDMEKGC